MTREALQDLLEAVDAAISSGDWKVDGACDPDAAIQRARKALAQPEQDWSMLEAMQGSLREHMARIKELESQLAQPEQEPVAWRYALTVEGTEVAVRYDHANWNMKYEPFGRHGIDHGGKVTRKPVYTTPPQRKPLTDEQKDRLANAWFSKDGDTDVSHRKAIALIEEVEAAHGIKEEA